MANKKKSKNRKARPTPPKKQPEEPIEEIKVPIEEIEVPIEEIEVPIEEIEVPIEEIEVPIDEIEVPSEKQKDTNEDAMPPLSATPLLGATMPPTMLLTMEATPIKAPAPFIKAAPPPIKAGAPTIKTPEPPIKAPAPFIKAAAPPIKAAAPPIKAPAPFINAAAPPIKAAAPPTKAPAPFINNAAPAIKAPAPPITAPAPPIKAATLPIKAPAPFIKAAAPAIKAPAPPIKIPDPPKELIKLDAPLEKKNPKLEEIIEDIKHPLENTWSFWLFTNKNKNNWTENLKNLTTFDTVEDYWCLYHHVKLPSQLMHGQEYSIFKKGISPMWEDEANKAGGRWMINLERRVSEIDRIWLDAVLLMIGENFENSNLICGAVVSVKPRNRVSIWTGNKDEAAIKEVGRKLKEMLRLQFRLQFLNHHKDLLYSV